MLTRCRGIIPRKTIRKTLPVSQTSLGCRVNSQKNMYYQTTSTSRESELPEWSSLTLPPGSSKRYWSSTQREGWPRRRCSYLASGSCSSVIFSWCTLSISFKLLPLLVFFLSFLLFLPSFPFSLSFPWKMDNKVIHPTATFEEREKSKKEQKAFCAHDVLLACEPTDKMMR